MIDDCAFARLWIDDRILHHPLSRDAVARELEDKGVAKTIATAALTERYPQVTERELVWRLARERYARLAGTDAEARARRTAGFLTRRGFPFGLAREVVRQLERGEDDE